MKKQQRDENTYKEWSESPHSGNAQGFNQPSPVGNFPPRKLPQAGEDLHGRRMSSLPSLREDFPPTAGADKPATYNETSMARAERAGQVLSHDDEEEEGAERIPGGENPNNPVATFQQANANIGEEVATVGKVVAAPFNLAAGAIGGLAEASKPTEDQHRDALNRGSFGPESVSAMDVWREKFNGGR